MESNKMALYLSFCALTLFLRTSGNPLTRLYIAHSVSEGNGTNTSASYTENRSRCARVDLDSKDVHFISKGSMFIPAYNATIHPSKMHIIKNNMKICFHPTDKLKEDIFDNCEVFKYNANEYRRLPNGSIVLYDVLIEDELYEINEEGKLKMCSVDYDDISEDEFTNLLPKPMDDVDIASMYIGKIGSAISILALSAHIITFCLVPSLRNLPGNNLISLSIAFLMAYSFTLIGQVPQVLGMFCIISAVFQQYFFLVAFFWMNVMAFDVWKTLKMATERLMVSTKTARRRQFLWYSCYAWIMPMCITAISVGVDNSQNLPDKIKPLFGRNSLCWFTNDVAKGIFFSLPAFILFLINAIFFVLSALILKNNTMKQTSDSEHRQTARLNFILYVRLALMMGITWLTGAIAIFSNSTVVWFFFDVLNSLQGLLVFLLFSCSRKVFRHIQDRISMHSMKTVSDKHTTDTTKCESK